MREVIKEGQRGFIVLGITGYLKLCSLLGVRHRDGYAMFYNMARGVPFGRPSKLRPDQKEVVRDLVKNGQSISAVARTIEVTRATSIRL